MAPSTLRAAPLDVADTAVTGGVDTHLDVHVAAALDRIGALLGTASFPTSPDGYEQLLRWLRGFGTIVQVGVDGTSSYGAGLTRTLQASGVLVVEVDLPNRQKRLRVGKSDTLDAIAPAPRRPVKPWDCPRARTETSRASGLVAAFASVTLARRRQQAGGASPWSVVIGGQTATSPGPLPPARR